MLRIIGVLLVAIIGLWLFFSIVRAIGMLLHAGLVIAVIVVAALLIASIRKHQALQR